KQRKAFFLWISLPENEPLAPHESILLKLTYTTKRKSLKTSFKELMDIKNTFSTPSRILFNVTKFRVLKTKFQTDYDTFYHVSVPDGYTIKYKINNATYVDSQENTQNIDESKLHVNFDGKILYIRTPSLGKQTNFDITYQVMPSSHEKWFYTTVVVSAIIFSSLVFYTGIMNIDKDIPFFLNQIKTHANLLYGGIFSGSIGAIGFMRGFATRKTRFWFLIPMIISAIGFLFFGN
ncbi:MAG: hypothetical protein IIA83_06645, partial [Thaumarchaeota archaeon]|nr:hypothetical protein [Nitrososphaerota archaeon]